MVQIRLDADGLGSLCAINSNRRYITRHNHSMDRVTNVADFLFKHLLVVACVGIVWVGAEIAMSLDLHRGLNNLGALFREDC